LYHKLERERKTLFYVFDFPKVQTPINAIEADVDPASNPSLALRGGL